PALLLSSLARTLAVAEEPGIALEDTLTAHLSDKSLLCLLDNIEHLLPEAAERIAALRAPTVSLLPRTRPPRRSALHPDPGCRRPLYPSRRASPRDRARRRPPGRLLDRAAARATV